MNPNNPQHFYEKVHKKEPDSALRILNAVALRPRDLQGKTIIDVGAGERELAKMVKKEGIDARVISYDMSLEALGISGDEENGDVVVANFFEGQFSSFRDEAVDIILNIGGPFRGGPYSSKSLEFYRDAIRVLKPGGEVRVYNPYIGELGGIAGFLYYQYHDTVDISGMDFEVFFGESYNNVEFDDRGVPTPVPPGDDFWIMKFQDLPKETQKEYYEYMTEDLNERLDPEGKILDVSLVERERKRGEYDACLIIKKRNGLTIKP